MLCNVYVEVCKFGEPLLRHFDRNPLAPHVRTEILELTGNLAF
jgi:hypothetical protein